MQTENNLQYECYLWAYNNFPQIRGLFFSVPNGGQRNQREAATLKATGLTPGIPDMILMKPLTGFEFKTLTGVISPAQQKIHDTWRKAGVEVYIIRDFGSFEKIIVSLLNAESH